MLDMRIKRPRLIGTHDPSVLIFCEGFVYCPMSSIRIVLAVEVGLKDGLDWMSVFIMNPSWNTEHGSSSTGYLSSYGLRFMTTCRNSLCRVYL